MRHILSSSVLSAILLAVLPEAAAIAADYPAPKQGDFVAHDFKFHDGEVMAELKLHYATVGEATGQPVLVLHGSGGSAASMLTPGFAGELFGAGQPLDASKYYIIIPDGIGHGKSSKPSDGMKTAFPKYDYNDMVEAQYRLIKEGLGIRHLRLVIGNSMGGMHTWLWAEKYPDMMDDARDHPQRSRLQQWQLHEPAAHDEICGHGLRLCDLRRHACLSGAGAISRKSRPHGRRAAGHADHDRRQRLHLSVGGLARLRCCRRTFAH
jgi:pimeloyl-ACP methyl ester carboxylesterase